MEIDQQFQLIDLNKFSVAALARRKPERARDLYYVCAAMEASLVNQ